MIIKYVNDEEEAIRQYLANQYLLWMTMAASFQNKDKKDLVEVMKRYFWILDYDWYPYVKHAKRVKWVGFDIMSEMLHVYRKIITMGYKI